MVKRIVPDCHADRHEEEEETGGAAASFDQEEIYGSTRGMGGCGVRPVAAFEPSCRSSTGRRGTPNATRRPLLASNDNCSTTEGRRAVPVLWSNCRIMVEAVCEFDASEHSVHQNAFVLSA